MFCWFHKNMSTFHRLILWYISWKLDNWNELTISKTSFVPSLQQFLLHKDSAIVNEQWCVEHSRFVINPWQLNFKLFIIYCNIPWPHQFFTSLWWWQRINMKHWRACSPRWPMCTSTWGSSTASISRRGHLRISLVIWRFSWMSTRYILFTNINKCSCFLSRQ